MNIILVFFQFCKIGFGNIIIKNDAGAFKCSISCPECNKKVALSSYMTQDGLEYRISNFSSHFTDVHGAAARKTPEIIQLQVLHQVEIEGLNKMLEERKQRNRVLMAQNKRLQKRSRERYQNMLATNKRLRMEIHKMRQSGAEKVAKSS